MQYIILNDDKTPMEKLSKGGKTFDKVKDFGNVGVMVAEPYVVFDFDSPSDANIITELVKELHIKCLVMKTTRGVHLWFKSPQPMKNSIKTRCAIGLYYDVRSYGKLSYTVIKKDCEWREWTQTYLSEEIEEVPFWLRPLSYNKNSFKEMSDGDGRNQALYEYILIMQIKGYTKDQIRTTVKLINDYVFTSPLPDSELNTILRDESFKPAGEIKETTEEITVKECFDEEGSFKHHTFARMIAEDMNIVTVNELCYIYKDGYYQHANRDIDKEMIAKYKRMRRSQRGEVIDYVRIITTVETNTIPRQEYIINLQNTRLDLKTGECLPFDPTIIDFCRIPVTYAPNAYCADLDKMLNKVFNDDQQVICLFEEMIGYLLIKNARFRKGFLFYGSGQNGKSTILNVIKHFVGSENCATVELEKLSETFYTSELENKLANIGDDINRKDISDTGTIKKLFTGEGVTVSHKYGQQFTLNNYAKLIFSCNEIPHIADKSNGMYSRLMFIPFTATFTPDDADYDPFIEDKVTTDEAMSYLLNIGLRGLKRLLHNNKFTNPTIVQDAFETYKTENSTVLTWLYDEGITLDELLEDTTDKHFSDFKDWCARSDVKFTTSLKGFHKEIIEKFDIDKTRCKNKTTGDKQKWKFIIKGGLI